MKRSRIQRKVGLKRTEFKRKPGYQLPRGGKLRNKARVSKRRRMLEAEQIEFPKGVPFDEVRNYLPASPSDWPDIVRVIDRPRVRQQYLAEVRGTACPLCHERPISEVHHICAGSRGRADERCNLLAVCGDCHREVQSVVSEYRRCWRAKREQDPDGCDWVRLIQLLGYWPAFTSLD